MNGVTDSMSTTREATGEPRTEAELVAAAEAGGELVAFGYRNGWSAALNEVEAAVAGLTFETPRECSCHQGEMRRVHEVEEARTVVLAALAHLRQGEPT